MTKDITKKKLIEQYHQQEKDAKLQEMPISQSELEELLTYLQTRLSHEDHGCDHTLNYTEKFFIQYPNKEDIISWLANYGGFCDCTVIDNVSNEYSFILEEYFQSIQEETLPSQEEIKPEIARLNSFDSSVGLFMKEIPKPWRLYRSRYPDHDVFHFCYGKRGLHSNFIIDFVENSLNIEPDEKSFFTQLWNFYNNYNPSNDLIFEKIFYTIQGKNIEAVIVTCPERVPVFG